MALKRLGRLLAAVGLVAFPVMAGLAVTAPQLVPVVFGPEWRESVPILQILSALGALFALGNLTGSVFLAKDRPDLGLKLNLLRMAILAAAAWLATLQIRMWLSK